MFAGHVGEATNTNATNTCMFASATQFAAVSKYLSGQSSNCELSEAGLKLKLTQVRDTLVRDIGQSRKLRLSV